MPFPIWKHHVTFSETYDDNDNENKFIAKVVQRKALQTAEHDIHIITDKQNIYICIYILKNQL